MSAPLIAAIPASKVAELTGSSLRQLRYLAAQDVCGPSVRESTGAGSESLYAPKDLVALLATARVRAIFGPEVRVERLRRITAALASRDAQRGQLLVCDQEASWITTADRLGVALHRSVAAVVIDLDALDDEVAARLDRVGLAA